MKRKIMRETEEWLTPITVHIYPCLPMTVALKLIIYRALALHPAYNGYSQTKKESLRHQKLLSG